MLSPAVLHQYQSIIDSILTNILLWTTFCMYCSNSSLLTLLCIMQVNDALQRVDTVIEKFINGLKNREIYDCVNFIILSDHGELYDIMCLYICVFAYVCMYIHIIILVLF